MFGGWAAGRIGRKSQETRPSDISPKPILQKDGRDSDYTTADIATLLKSESEDDGYRVKCLVEEIHPLSNGYGVALSDSSGNVRAFFPEECLVFNDEEGVLLSFILKHYLQTKESITLDGRFIPESRVFRIDYLMGTLDGKLCELG